MVRELKWAAADFLTGAILLDLPTLELTAPLAVSIGQAEQVVVNLYLNDKVPAGWYGATTPGKSVLVAYFEDLDNIVWGGIVQQRDRGNTTVVELTLASAETYLDACYIGDYTATDENQDTIVSDLLAFADGTAAVGFPFWERNHVAPSTATQSVTYTADSNTSVLAGLQALSGTAGGPEWVITWTRFSDTQVRAVFTYGSRIGAAAGLNGPNVVVELEDLQDDSNLHEDYSNGQGANVVRAYGTAPENAADDSVPSAVAEADDKQGRPYWEYRYQPSGTITDPAVLAGYAAAALSVMQNGTQPLVLVLANDLPGKRLGVDWNIGDDMGWFLTGIAFPETASGVARCVGYRLDLATVTPILKGPAT